MPLRELIPWSSWHHCYCNFHFLSEETCKTRRLGLEDRCLTRKAGTSLVIENVNPFSPKNSENLGLSSKDLGKGVTVLHWCVEQGWAPQQQRLGTDTRFPGRGRGSGSSPGFSQGTQGDGEGPFQTDLVLIRSQFNS